MALKKAVKPIRDVAMTFNFQKESSIQLKTLAEYSNMSFTDVIEHLVEAEYKNKEKADESDLLASRNKVLKRKKPNKKK